MAKGVFLMGLCILSSVLASLAVKQGANGLPDSTSLRDLLGSPMIWLGGLFYGAAFVGYIYALRIVPLSLAQPVITTGVSMLTVVAAAYLFRESLHLFNWLGLGLVCVGIYLLFYGRY